MRILVYGMVGSQRGGIESFLLNMNAYMSKETIFDYVIEEDHCIHEKEIRARGGNIYYIMARSKNPIKNISDNKKLLKKLRGTTDAIYFNLSSLSWIEPIRLALSEKYRVYVHAHNSQFISQNSTLAYRIVNYINKYRLGNYQIQRLTCSKPCSEFLYRTCDKVQMIYNAVDMERFIYNEEKRVYYRKLLNADENVALLGFVGRIQGEKNPSYLLKIIKAISKQGEKVKMIIVGEGDLKKALEEEVDKEHLQECVEFLGKRDDVNCLMQAMDVLLLPSFHEGLPYVVVEAQAAGLRCLVSENVTREVDYTGTVHFLKLEPNAENWTEAFAEKHSTDYDRLAISKMAAESNFNINVEAHRLEQILRN